MILFLNNEMIIVISSIVSKLFPLYCSLPSPAFNLQDRNLSNKIGEVAFLYHLLLPITAGESHERFLPWNNTVISFHRI